MKSKKLFKKWWFWLIIALILLVGFFYPKSCGFYGGFNPQGIECDCIGKKVYHYMDTVCYGICLKNTCERIPPLYGYITEFYCSVDNDCAPCSNSECANVNYLEVANCPGNRCGTYIKECKCVDNVCTAITGNYFTDIGQPTRSGC